MSLNGVSLTLGSLEYELYVYLTAISYRLRPRISADEGKKSLLLG